MTYRNLNYTGLSLPGRRSAPQQGENVDHRLRMMAQEVNALREIVGVLRSELIKAQNRITVLESGIRPHQE